MKILLSALFLFICPLLSAQVTDSVQVIMTTDGSVLIGIVIENRDSTLLLRHEQLGNMIIRRKDIINEMDHTNYNMQNSLEDRFDPPNSIKVHFTMSFLGCFSDYVSDQRPISTHTGTSKLNHI